MVSRFLAALCALLVGVASTGSAQATPISVYGAWLCSNDGCAWSTVRNMTDFDTQNNWLINRGDGSGLPSVNLVVLAFADPLVVLNNDSLPVGMTPAIVQYFTSKGVRVMVSIGGITYTSNWDSALASNPTQLGINAANLAKSLGVGVEIDYENGTPNTAGLTAFVNAYRSVNPVDMTGANPAARLTVDLGAGDRYLGAMATWAAPLLSGTTPTLDYANAMVPSKQPSASAAQANWSEHINGEPQYAPPIPPLAPARFTGSLYITDSTKPIAECISFGTSLELSTDSFVQTVAPNGAGTTPGLLGYMFWAAEAPSSRNVTTDPPNACTGGVGVGAKTYDIPIPMPALTRY